MKRCLDFMQNKSSSSKSPSSLVVNAFLAIAVGSSFALTAVAAEIPTDPVQVIHGDMRRHIADKAQLRVLAEGFQWAEGPVVEAKTGDVLFSDVPANKVHRYSSKSGLSLYLAPSGYTGLWPDRNPGQGANGLIFNQKGELVLAQHGDRCLAVLKAEAPKPSYQCIAQRFGEKLLNSPNDVVQAKDGSYYFTDPPYGLSDGDKSPEKQQPVNGVYRLAPNGEVTLLVSDLTRPNGLAFSPDGQFLYVANSDPAAAKWWRYPVLADGELGSGTLWYDATSLTSSEAGLPDGLKVKKDGTVIATGPGGLWFWNSSGQLLGRVKTGVASANVALSKDERTLYITASQYLLEIKLKF